MSSTASLVENYSELVRRPLKAEECSLVVIDVQEKLLPPIAHKEELIKNVRLLIRLAEILHIPTIATTQYQKGLGGTVPDIRPLLPEPAIDKQVFSCFGSDVFCSSLKRLGAQRNTVLVCGMESHICVTQTVLEGLRQRYLVHVASDAVGSRTEWNRKIGLERMREAGAVISSTEMIIYELLGTSQTEAFKQMLPWLR